MADDNDTQWKLDLDNKDFIAKLLESKNALSSMGDSKNLSGLTSSLLEVGAVLGTLGVAFYALKGTMEAVFAAEDIKQVNTQFEAMTQNVGIMGDALKKALVESSGGLVSETELLKSANKALAEMGDNAAKLPEVMTLARQATAVMGGDLMSNFEGINRAISTGNTRMLRHMGIVIDQRKAYADYAKSIGATVDSLSLAGKQEAVLNALLDVGKEKFAGANLNVKEASNAWVEFKVALKEFYDIFVLVFDKTVGPSLTRIFKSLGDTAKFLKNEFTASFGEGAEQSAAKIKVLETNIDTLQKRVTDMKTAKQDIFSPGEWDMANKQLKQYQDELAKIKESSKAGGSVGTSDEEIEAKKKADRVEDDLRQKQAEKVKEEYDKLQKELLAIKEKNTEDQKQVDLNYEQERQNIIAQSEDAINKIRIEVNQGAMLEGQANQLIIEQDEIKNEKLKALEDDLLAKRIAAADKYASHSRTVSEGISRGWQAEASKINNSNTAMAEVGKKSFGAVQTNAKKAFVDMGSGAKSGGEAMKGFFFGSLGDMAEASGEFHLAKGLASLNPLEIAQAGVLLALSGALHAAAGGGGGGGVGAGGGGGGAAGAGGGPVAMEQAKPEAAQMAEKKTVTIAIQGHYFETEQTQTRLMEMMRATQDATDFNLTKIGV